MDTKVNLGQQGALVAEVTVAFQAVGAHCQHVKGSDPSLHSALVGPQLQCWVWIWAPHNKSDLDMLERMQGRATNVSGSLEHLEGLRDLGLFSCEEAQGHLIIVWKYLQGGWEEGGAQWCPVMGPEALAQTGAQEVPSEHQKPFCIVRMTKYWHRMPRDVESLSLEIFQSHLDMVLGNWSCLGRD